MLPKIAFQDLGFKAYQEAWDLQFALQKGVIEHKQQVRQQLTAPPSVSDDFEAVFKETLIKTQQGHLLFCEHNHVYTLGKSGDVAHLLLSEQELTEKGITFFKINRGGDITYHGQGQITGYPIFDLDCFFTDVHKYVRLLEEVIIQTMAEYGLIGMRIKEYTGVWLEADATRPKRKICAIGVHLSRWVTMHGFAFNVNTDLQFFDYIVPCGIADADKAVTSLAQELGHPLDMEEVKRHLKKHFAAIFGFDWV